MAIAQLMDSLSLADRIDQHFPLPKSNRGFRPSEFIKTLILMQHEGSFHLDDIRHLQDDEALRTVLDLNTLPRATTWGDWLRRMGSQPQIQDAWVKVNQALLQSALYRCKKVTLDIDATEIVAHKADAQWTYNKNKGFMPMVGHIAETGQVVAVDFRQGNIPPAQDIHYAIRAKTSAAMRAQIEAARDSDSQECSEGISLGGYIYRAIATNRDGLSDSHIIHWYNQRAEDSENRIKELKLDFGGDTLPCSDFKANALYFLISALSYNLFALMRQLLPEELAHHRVMTLRWRLYAIAAKVVRSGRQLFVKLKEKHRTLLEQVLFALKEFEPPPI